MPHRMHNAFIAVHHFSAVQLSNNITNTNRLRPGEVLAAQLSNNITNTNRLQGALLLSLLVEELWDRIYLDQFLVFFFGLNLLKAQQNLLIFLCFLHTKSKSKSKSKIKIKEKKRVE
jgi:hypothetical protein